MKLRISAEDWEPFATELRLRKDVESAGIILAEVKEGGEVLVARSCTGMRSRLNASSARRESEIGEQVWTKMRQASRCQTCVSSSSTAQSAAHRRPVQREPMLWRGGSGLGGGTNLVYLFI